MVLFFQTARQALRLLGRERRWRWAVVITAAAFVTAFEAIGAVLMFTLLGLVGGEAGGVELPLIGDVYRFFPGVPEQTLLVGAAVVVGVFFVIRAATIIAQQYLQSRIVHNAAANLATHLARGYLAVPYVDHVRHNSAELVRNAFESGQRLVGQVLKPLVDITSELMLVIGMGVVLLVLAPTATLMAILVLGPILWLLLRVIQPRLRHLGRVSQDARRGSLQALQQALGGFRDIRLLGREEEFAGHFRRERRTLARTEYLRTVLSELPRAVIETALVMVIVLIFILALLAGEGVETVLSTLGVFAYAGLRLQPSLRKLVGGLNAIRFGSAILDDLSADKHRVDLALEERQRRLEEQPSSIELQRAIEISDVTFAYDTEATPALLGVNLTIRKGEFIGVCGPTGGGKSTLIDIITGLLQPTSGQVLIDGRALTESPFWWHAQLGVVSQSVFLTDDSLRNNIVFGDAQEGVDHERLERAIERAQLLEVVAGLPEGLDTLVGERGVRLSGGQRQRVAVARALYREPSVIIFDEGTSALDSATEAALVTAIDELKAGRTLISVAHRISTVRDADRIIVVDAGRIVGLGSYDELLNHNELFRSLAQSRTPDEPRFGSHRP